MIMFTNNYYRIFIATNIWILILMSNALVSQNAQEIKEMVLAEEAFENAELSIFVKNISTDKILLDHRKDKNLAPASILKINTAVHALRGLGPNHRFKTELYLTGDVEEGVLYGNILIKGFGDPSFHTDQKGAVSINDLFSAISSIFKENNVTCVYGSVVADASYFALPAIPSGYIEEDIGNYYGAGAYGLNVRNNAYKIVFERSKSKIARIVRFDSLAISFATADVTIAGSSDQAYAYDHPDGNGVHVVGRIPVGRGDFSIKAALQNPPLFGAKMLQKKLLDAGIEFQNNAKANWLPNDVPDNILWKQEYLSPPLHELLGPVLQKSNNVYAEVIHRHLRLSETSEKSPTNAKLFDGSGLSPANRISASELMQSLETAVHSKYLNHFLNAMPLNGKSGTVRSVLKKSPGRLYIKSGSIGGVRSYMGLRQSIDGEWIGFVCMANELSSPASASRRAWETLLNWIANF